MKLYHFFHQGSISFNCPTIDISSRYTNWPTAEQYTTPTYNNTAPKVLIDFILKNVISSDSLFSFHPPVYNHSLPLVEEINTENNSTEKINTEKINTEKINKTSSWWHDEISGQHAKSNHYNTESRYWKGISNADEQFGFCLNICFIKNV